MKMTITRRIQIGFAWTAFLVLVLASGVIAQSFWLQSWREDYRKSVAKTNMAATVQVSLLDTVVYALDSDSLETATQTEIQSVQENTAASLREIEWYVNALEASADEQGKSIIEDVSGLLEQYRSAFDQVFTLAASDVKLAQEKLRDVRPILIRLEEKLNQFVVAEKATGDDMLTKLESTSRAVMYSVGAVAAVAVLAALGGAFWISRMITRQLRGAFTRLGSSAAELMAVSSQVAAGAAQTAASTSEATVTVEEVKQTAILASEKADEVGEESKDLPRVADTGRNAAELTAAAFERAQDRMTSVADTISQLSESTDAVEEIIATVNDLAEQSNLLSVNASIEAAKAGEYGRGFSVVAQEVKSLAEQSKAAVVQARAVLGEIIKATELAIRAAGEGQDTVKAGLQQSAESGQVIFTLAESASRSAESAIQISASARQQLAGMEQIGQAMDSISQAGEHSAAGTRQVQEEVMHLQELAVELRGLVDRKGWTIDAGASPADTGEDSAR